MAGVGTAYDIVAEDVTARYCWKHLSDAMQSAFTSTNAQETAVLVQDLQKCEFRVAANLRLICKEQASAFRSCLGKVVGKLEYDPRLVCQDERYTLQDCYEQALVQRDRAYAGWALKHLNKQAGDHSLASELAASKAEHAGHAH